MGGGNFYFEKSLKNYFEEGFKKAKNSKKDILINTKICGKC